LPGRSAQQHGKRHARCLGERVPHRHVEARDRDQRHALEADEPERRAPAPEVIEGRERLAAPRLGQITDRRHEVAGGLLERLEIAAADDALLGLKIDQDDRPVVEQPDLRDHRSLEGHDDRRHLHRPQGERLERHQDSSFRQRRPPAQATA
jgi:hypothetical protein